MAGQKTQKKLRIAAVLAGLLALVLISPYYFTAKEEQKREAPERLLTFAGLPADADIKATLTMDGRTVELASDGDGLVMTPELRENFTLPYTLQMTIRSANGYRDFSWRIDRRGVDYYILADGFKREDKITLVIEDQPVFTIPFDWSGRIELPIVLQYAFDTTVCIFIREGSNAAKTGFCHFNPGNKQT
jgi:hypothetical protein